MKLPAFPLLAAAVVGLSFSSCGSKDTGTPSAPPSAGGTSSSTDKSPDLDMTPFNRVMQRLDVGGKTLEVHDHAGQREMLLSIAEMLLSTSLAEMPQDKLDMPALMDALGTGRSAASGLSVRKDDEAWLLRSYSYQPTGRRGPATLLGTASTPFSAPETLPATVDLVFETKVDISALPAMVADIAKASGQEEAGTEFLKQELPSGGALVDILGQSKLHIIIGIDVSSWNQPDGKNQLDFFVRINGGKMILQSLQPQITQALGEPEMAGKLRQWQIPLEAIGQGPALLLADEDGSLTLASTRQYLEAVQGSGSKLATDSSFVASTNHFPKSGNLLVYASPQVPTFLASMIKERFVPQVEKELAPLLAKATDYLEPRPWSLCFAYEADGTMLTAEMPFAYDSQIANTLPLLSVTSVMFVGAKAWKDGSDRATCVLNIRNAQVAMRSYQALNGLNNGDSIPWDKVYSPEFVQTNKPVCPTGGTYTFAAKFPETGVVACECSNPDHKPPHTENW